MDADIIENTFTGGLVATGSVKLCKDERRPQPMMIRPRYDFSSLPPQIAQIYGWLESADDPGKLCRPHEHGLPSSCAFRIEG